MAPRRQAGPPRRRDAGPDCTRWLGLYEVAKELLDKRVYVLEGHVWHRDGMSKEAPERIQKFHQDRYKQ